MNSDELEDLKDQMAAIKQDIATALDGVTDAMADLDKLQKMLKNL